MIRNVRNRDWKNDYILLFAVPSDLDRVKTAAVVNVCIGSCFYILESCCPRCRSPPHLKSGF